MNSLYMQLFACVHYKITELYSSDAQFSLYLVVICMGFFKTNFAIFLFQQKPGSDNDFSMLMSLAV